MDSTTEPLVAYHSDGSKLTFPDAETRLRFFAALGVVHWDNDFGDDTATTVARFFFRQAMAGGKQ